MHTSESIFEHMTQFQKTLLDHIGLRWLENNDGTYIPTVSDVSPAPEAFAELVKCSSDVSKCRVRYSCKAHIMTCIELCKFEAPE